MSISGFGIGANTTNGVGGLRLDVKSDEAKAAKQAKENADSVDITDEAKDLHANSGLEGFASLAQEGLISMQSKMSGLV